MRNRAPDRKASERGAALLTVLLLVAVIAVLAGAALEKMRLATRLGANSIAMGQAQAYAMAAETLAMTRIDGLLSRDAARVTLAGGWSGKPFPLPVPGGLATATVTDGGNCFNLNSLVTQRSPGEYVARPDSVTQFARLMRLIGIPLQTGDGIAASAADWIDSDSIALPSGNEDGAYTGQAQHYRTGNTLMTDVSELRAVAGVTPEIYAKLRKYLCVQPRAERSKINVNTLLPEDAALFAMLLPDTLDIGQASSLLLQRPPQGFSSTVEFWKIPSLKGVIAGPQAYDQTAVTTQWFALRVDVQLGGSELSQSALIDARQQPARLVSRSWGDPA